MPKKKASSEPITTAPKPFCFVLMPFSEEFHDVYNLGIKEACKNAGAYCERVDEQIFDERILDRIYNQISKADIVIADMTGRNPNVFYEVGYTHALGKLTILLTRNADDIPFDLKHFPHIVYGTKISLLQDELEKRVKHFIEKPNKSIERTDSVLEFYLKGNKLENKARTGFEPRGAREGNKTFLLGLDVHNASEKVFDASNIEFGLILPVEFRKSIGLSTVMLPDEKCMHLLPKVERMLPQGWQPVPIKIEVKEIKDLIGNQYNGIIRIFSETGTRDLEFIIEIK